MTKKDVIQQLETIFDAIKRYEETPRYFDFFVEYVVFLLEEEKYFPNIIKTLYRNSELSFDDIMLLSLDYYHFKNSLSENETKDTPLPMFLDKDFTKEIKYFEKTSKFLEEEKKVFSKKDFKQNFSHKPPSKEDIFFDIERLHVKMIRELKRDNLEDISLNKGCIVIGEKEILIEDKTVMYPVINSLEQRKLGKYVGFDEVAMDDNEKYNEKYREKMYQACRRINDKVFSKTGVKNFLKYDTRQVKVNI